MQPYSKILVVDDDPVTTSVLEDSLKADGYAVHSVASSEEALTLLKSDPSFRLILLDWVMPGMSGIELCREIRQFDELTYRYVILLTAKNDAGAVAEGYEAGADDYITKPVGRDGLQRRIHAGERALAREDHIRERAQRCAEVEERAARTELVGVLTSGLVHALTTPHQYIRDNTQFLDETLSALWPHMLADTRTKEVLKDIPDTDEQLDVDYLATEVPRAVAHTLQGAEKVSALLRSMKYFVEPENTASARVNPSEMLEAVVAVSRNEWERVADVTFTGNDSIGPIRCNRVDISFALLSIIIRITAIVQEKQRFLGQGARGSVLAECRTRGDSEVELRFTDTSAAPEGTTEVNIEAISERLNFARRVIVDEHQGKLHVENNAERHLQIGVVLPLLPESAV